MTPRYARASELRAEWRSLRQLHATLGLRAGTVERARQLLGISELADRAVVDRLGATLAQAVNDLVGVDRNVALRALHEQMWATMTWLDLIAPSSDVLISVVLATRDRAALLPRAIASVLAQRHRALELLVVDDSEDGSAKGVVAALDDPRVRVLASGGIGASGARNVALDVAKGEIVSYLDDDNVMHPGWLRAVAWAFDRWPGTDVVYGARLFERSDVMVGDGRDVPVIELQPWDRAQLETYNYIDLNVLAHRAGLPDARFNETWRARGDWDLALRLTAAHPPRVLPHVACAYTTSAPNRITDTQPSPEPGEMRVLMVESQFPLMSETYIDEDRRALIDGGAAVAVYRDFPTIAPAPGVPLAFTDLDEAIRIHRPDVALLHWADFALGYADRLTALDLPFAVRVHSFDFAAERVAALAAHPGCVAVWVHEHRMDDVDGLALPYRPFIWPPPPAGLPSAQRTLVLSTSAGLPKKDWPTLLGALAQLVADGVEARAIAGFSYDLEDVPADVARLLRTFPQSPLVQFNVPRSDVFTLLGRTAVLVYTLADGWPIGMPMSIIEGLCAGASVVVPDIPGVERVAGPHARRYRTQEDIVAHAHEVLGGGPAIEAEHRANRELGLRTYADPRLRTQLHEELRAALASYHAAR
jgi:glycosyltransferase involved in cell wall biosynthesis